MRSFSFISLAATLALTAFTSAAPLVPVSIPNVPAIPSLPVDVPAVPEVSSLQSRCAGCDLIKGVIASIQVEVDTIDNLTAPVTAEVLSLSLNKVITIVTGAVSTIKADATSLVGLAITDVITLLCELLTLVTGLVSTVLGLVGSLDVSDVTNIKALIGTLLCAVGDLLCLVLSVVGSLLGSVGPLVAQVLGSLTTVPGVSDVIHLVDGVVDHFPLQLGGTLPVADIYNLATGLVGGLLKAL